VPFFISAACKKFPLHHALMERAGALNDWDKSAAYDPLDLLEVIASYVEVSKVRRSRLA